ncbi:MAG: SAM-dependent methyltransferase, partial [Myxococcota bacterium]
MLSERGFAESPREAAALILAAKVLVVDAQGRERRLEKAGERLDAAVRFRLKGERGPWVSRAGGKLEAGLTAFKVEVQDRVALDLGLSTGGFTDCLLSRGARRVHGVDVAYGVVNWRLRN